jgi:hypothetical protein
VRILVGGAAERDNNFASFGKSSLDLHKNDPPAIDIRGTQLEPQIDKKKEESKGGTTLRPREETLKQMKNQYN